LKVSILYVVATPIGNLEDITLRALRVLKEADLILCEDTRQTKKLLNHYGISRPTLSCHQHSQPEKISQIIALLKEGKNLALVSDAGTPGISDPGSKLVDAVVKSLGEGIKIIPIPGPSALISAASISGFGVDRFLFLGFLPHKKGRETLIREIAASAYPVVFYESPHRIIRALGQLREALAVDRQITVGRELTKKFESVYRGTAEEVMEKLSTDQVKGEFVVVVNRK